MERRKEQDADADALYRLYASEMYADVHWYVMMELPAKRAAPSWS